MSIKGLVLEIPVYAYNAILEALGPEERIEYSVDVGGARPKSGLRMPGIALTYKASSVGPLSAILAMIHGDGGQHQRAVGTEQALLDAIPILENMKTGGVCENCKGNGKYVIQFESIPVNQTCRECGGTGGTGKGVYLYEALKVLNEAAQADNHAIKKLLFDTRVKCNDPLKNHPTIQCADNDIGPLGLINGIFGVNADGRGRICAVVNTIDGSIRFKATEEMDR